jgi:predicted ATPase
MIVLKELTINNYKNLNLLNITDLDDTKVLIGINGAGKSNILNVLSFLCFSLHQGFKNTLSMYDHSSVDYFNFNLPKENIVIKFVFCSKEDRSVALYEYTVVLGHKKNEENKDDFNIVKENILAKDTNKIDTLVQQENKILHPHNLGIAYNQIQSFLSQIASYNGYQNKIIWVNKQIEYEKINLNNKDSIKQTVQILLYLEEKYIEHYKKIIQLLKYINPLIENVVINKKDKTIKIKISYLKEPIDISNLSDGTKRVFSLFTMLNLPIEIRPSMFLLEEPEIGIAPHILEVIGDLIDIYSQDSQIIFTTQSPLLLNKIELQHIVIVAINTQTGDLNLNKIDKIKIKPWLEKYTIGELWLMNLIGATLINS